MFLLPAMLHFFHVPTLQTDRQAVVTFKMHSSGLDHIGATLFGPLVTLVCMASAGGETGIFPLEICSKNQKFLKNLRPNA